MPADQENGDPHGRDVSPFSRGPRPSRLGPWVLLAVALGAFAAVALTINDPGLTIDEPNYLHAAQLMAHWFSQLASAGSGGEAAGLVSRHGIATHWFYHCEGLYHPPGVGYLQNLAWLVTRDLVPGAGPWRMSGAFLLALSAAALVSLTARAAGLGAGFAAGLLMVTTPRVFGHAHLAATDFPLLAGWVLCTLAWLKAPESRWWTAALVPMLAWTFLIKFTGLGVLVPLWGWTLAFRRRAWRRFLIVSAAAGLLAVACDPPLWHDPLGELGRYVAESLGRGRFARIPVYYRGRVYDHRLPWHNGFVLTAVTVPAVTLFLAVVGLAAVAARRFREPFGTVCALHVGFFLLVRALPGPHHDGVRLFLPLFAFVAGLAGMGVGALGRLAGRRVRVRPLRWAGGAAALAALTAYGAGQVASVHPYQLSYYSELIGGLSGAAARGFQATYWFDAVTPGMLDEMARQLPLQPRLLCLPPTGADTVTFSNRRLGRLRPDLMGLTRPPADYVLVILRQDELGKFDDLGWRLHRGEAGPPLIVRSLDGVPLAALYRCRVEAVAPASRPTTAAPPQR